MFFSFLFLLEFTICEEECVENNIFIECDAKENQKIGVIGIPFSFYDGVAEKNGLQNVKYHHFYHSSPEICARKLKEKFKSFGVDPKNGKDLVFITFIAKKLLSEEKVAELKKYNVAVWNVFDLKGSKMKLLNLLEMLDGANADLSTFKESNGLKDVFSNEKVAILKPFLLSRGFNKKKYAKLYSLYKTEKVYGCVKIIKQFEEEF